MVEWKKMWEITAWDKKFQGVEKYMQKTIIPYKYLLAKDLFALSVPNGNIKLLSTGVQEGWTSEELAGDLISEGEVVTIPWGKSPGAQNPVKYFKGRFITGDNRIATSLDTNILNNKFLYYWMYSNSNLIETFYRGAGIQHPSMFKVLNMSIPIPSLSEQNRIVGILDTFTDSIENLKQQIAQRRKQYEFYRNQLLDLEGKEGVEMKVLTEICESNRGVRVVKKELQKSGLFPVFQNSIAPMGYYHKCNYDKPTPFVISAGAAGEVGFCETSFWAADDCLCITCSKAVLPKYVFYFLSKNNYYLKTKVRKGAIPRLSRKVVESLLIPVIDIELQNTIVKKLDTFEASISNLEAQLAQRQKQYEYYRNKLLSFGNGDGES